jgi:O-antigen/teichoic acid export membrane protein
MGNGRRKRPRFPGLESLSIARNDVAANAKFAAVDARGHIFPGNRGSARGKFTPSRKTNYRKSRAIGEIRANWRFILTASFTNLVYLVNLNIYLVNLNIPLWTVSSVFGLQAAGWFAAARRIVGTPAQFALNTLNVAFNQRIRAKQARGVPILSDVLLLIGLLLAALAPVFIALGWLAHSPYLALLGADWAGAGPTLAVMIFIACGRFAVMAAAALIALAGWMGYASWIGLYALSEMALYGASAGWIVLYVWRNERRAAEGRSVG